MNAIILAAGLGTRLKPLTDRLPKPLLPVMNKPIIEAVIDKVSLAGCVRIGVNVHYQQQALSDFLSKYTGMIKLSYEEAIAGTGGAFLGFEDLFDDIVLLHNCDVLSEIDIAELIAFHRRISPLATIAVTKNAGTDLVSIENERVIRFNKVTQKDNRTYTGIAVLSPRIREFFPPGQRCFSLVDHVFARALASGEEIRVFPSKGRWIDIGSPDSFWTAHKLLAERKMIVKEIPQCPAVCVHETSTLKTARVSGFLVVGPRSTVEEEVEIASSIVFPDSRIEKGSFTNCIISDDFLVQCSDHEKDAGQGT